MDTGTIVILFLAGGLVAWALRMVLDIRRGRQEGCVNCNLSGTPFAHPPNGIVCKTCGGFTVDQAGKRKMDDAAVP